MIKLCILTQLLAITRALQYNSGDATTYAYSPLASFGRVPMHTGEIFVIGQAAPFDACTPISETLFPLIRGKSLLIQRGGCSFVRKACMAQQAGAAAAVVYNSFETDASSSARPGQPAGDIQSTPINYPVHMFGISNEIKIPIVMVSSRDGIILNQLIMHGDTKTTINITAEAPPAECGAWDRWPDSPLQCNSRAQQLNSFHVPLESWLESRREAAYYVVGDVEIARLVFIIGSVLAFAYLMLAGLRKTRMDSPASQMQNEQRRRVVNIFVTFSGFFFASFSYGIDMWGGDCDSDHVATVFMLQRLAGTCCVISYLVEAYYVNSNADGHTNPYLHNFSKTLPTKCGRAWIKMQVAELLFVDFLIAYFYATKNRSYPLFVGLSVVRIALQLTSVLVTHFGAVKNMYTSVMIDQHLGSDATSPIKLSRELKNRYQFLLLAKLSTISLLVQGLFATVQVVQQAVILLLPNSLDFPAVWLDSYFTFLALPQLFQLWASLGFGSGLYFLFVHCQLTNETPRDIKLGLEDSHRPFLAVPSSSA